MWKFLLFILILGVIGAVFRVIIFVVLLVIGVITVFYIFKGIYYLFNSGTSKTTLAKENSNTIKVRSKEYVTDKNRRNETIPLPCRNSNQTEKLDKSQTEKNRNDSFSIRLSSWRLREFENRENRNLEYQLHRDSDQQEKPYEYQISTHGNESLSIRYGIVNQERKIKEYWYFAKGGEKKRNLDRDKMYYDPARTIRLQKTKKVSKDLYEVMLTDYRNRKAKAIIEPGTEYVKTFYPLDDGWFEKHEDLELTLKGNGSFTLKELATFHVNKAVSS